MPAVSPDRADTIASPAAPRKLYGVIAASSLGTLIEWYDFYIFGSLASIISLKFFPPGNPTAAFLATLATFAAGFIVRPFGALVFGRLGDRAGRKYTFLLTLLIMGGSTFLIGLIPDYSHFHFAPLVILLLRLLQGLALGGEYGGAATYVAEYAPPGRRGYFTSWIQTTATLGLFISLMVILACQKNLSPEAFNDWGWRLPFLLSIFLVIISIFIRLRMQESPLFARLKAEGQVSTNPLRESFRQRANLKMVLLALFGVTMGQGVIWYTGQFYAQTFLLKTCSIDPAQVNVLLGWALLAATPFFVICGALSDRIGRKPIMMAGMLLAVICYRPIFHELYTIASQGIAMPGPKKLVHLASAQAAETVGLIFLLVLFVTMVYGPIAAYLVELFPTRIRYSSMSLPYHIGNGVFGGLVPFIATLMVEYSKTAASPGGDPLAGLWYPISVASVCLVIGLIYVRKSDAYERA